MDIKTENKSETKMVAEKMADQLGGIESIDFADVINNLKEILTIRIEEEINRNERLIDDTTKRNEVLKNLRF